jgi:hypothetical protein
MVTQLESLASLVLAVFLVACGSGSSSGPENGSAGTIGDSGGSGGSATGGFATTGGARSIGTGGFVPTGGAAGTGGFVATGGAAGTGGSWQSTIPAAGVEPACAEIKNLAIVGSDLLRK